MRKEHFYFIMNEDERRHKYKAKRKRQKKRRRKERKKEEAKQARIADRQRRIQCLYCRLSAAKIRSNMHLVLLITRKYRDTGKEINGRLAKEIFSAANVLLTN